MVALGGLAQLLMQAWRDVLYEDGWHAHIIYQFFIIVVSKAELCYQRCVISMLVRRESRLRPSHHFGEVLPNLEPAQE